jgi:electron transfer flavoprotein beta subunit
MRPTLPSLINVLVPVKRSIDYAVYVVSCRPFLRLHFSKTSRSIRTLAEALALTRYRKIRIASDGKGVDTNVKHSMVRELVLHAETWDRCIY